MAKTRLYVNLSLLIWSRSLDNSRCYSWLCCNTWHLSIWWLWLLKFCKVIWGKGTHSFFIWKNIAKSRITTFLFMVFPQVLESYFAYHADYLAGNPKLLQSVSMTGTSILRHNIESKKRGARKCKCQFDWTTQWWNNILEKCFKTRCSSLAVSLLIVGRYCRTICLH